MLVAEAERRRGRAAGDADDRAGDAARRPLRAWRDDPAPGGGLGRPRPGATGILERLRTSAHARLPAARGEIDRVVGVLHAKDVLHQMIGWRGRDRSSGAPGPHDPRRGGCARCLGGAAELAGRHGLCGRRARHLRGRGHRSRPPGGDRRPVREPGSQGRAPSTTAGGRLVAVRRLAAGRGHGGAAQARPARARDYHTTAGFALVGSGGSHALATRSSSPAGGSRWSTSTGAASTRCWHSLCASRGRYSLSSARSRSSLLCLPAPAAAGRESLLTPGTASCFHFRPQRIVALADEERSH